MTKPVGLFEKLYVMSQAMDQAWKSRPYSKRYRRELLEPNIIPQCYLDFFVELQLA